MSTRWCELTPVQIMNDMNAILERCKVDLEPDLLVPRSYVGILMSARYAKVRDQMAAIRKRKRRPARFKRW